MISNPPGRATPSRRLGVRAAALILLCVGTGLRTAAAPPLLATDFPRSPLATGWELQGMDKLPLDSAWLEAKDPDDAPGLQIRQGCLLSPALPVQPFHYYRLEMRTRTADAGTWAAVFYDAAGKPLVADDYDSVPASTTWQAQRFCFRGHAWGTQVRLRFQPGKTPLTIAACRLEEVSAADVAAWADSLLADNPELHYTAPATRLELLPKTAARLQQGGKLRIVMLGDSICNDTSNSLFETLLMRQYPKTQIEVVTSVRGGTGCDYYQEKKRVQEYALRFTPDLVIIAGISHGYRPEPILSVVRQIRQGSAAEILVVTGAITPEETLQELHLKYAGRRRGEELENIAGFPANLQRLAADERVAVLDMRRAWDDYVRQSSRPNVWFQRDEIHGNARGKQAAGHILARFLGLEPASR